MLSQSKNRSVCDASANILLEEADEYVVLLSHFITFSKLERLLFSQEGEEGRSEAVVHKLSVDIIFSGPFLVCVSLEMDMLVMLIMFAPVRASIGGLWARCRAADVLNTTNNAEKN